MEDTVKDQLSAASGSKGGSASSKLLRYPLRSSIIKSKDEKSAAVEPSPLLRRGRSSSIVSKSVSVLELSGKDKSTKPPRRLSIPAKSTVTPAPRTVGNITPISEARAKRPLNSQNKSETPNSDVSRSANRKKYCALSSASYWLTQIKLSEVAAKHSISLGFFKLALEAGCEVQRLRDELKSYARRYNLAEFGESAKQLLESYNIKENVEQLQVSETYSQVPEEGARSCDDDSRSSSSASVTGKLRPKCLNNNSSTPVKDSGKVTSQKTKAVPRTKAPVAKKKPATSSSTSEPGRRKMQKKSLMPNNKESVKNAKIEKKKSANEEGPNNLSPAEEGVCEENKENLDAPQTEEISLTEV